MFKVLIKNFKIKYDIQSYAFALYVSNLQKYKLRKTQRGYWVTFYLYFAYLRILEGGCRTMRICIVKYDVASKSWTIFHYSGQGENRTSIIDTHRAILPLGCVRKKNLIVVDLYFGFMRILTKTWNVYKHFIGFKKINEFILMFFFGKWYILQLNAFWTKKSLCRWFLHFTICNMLDVFSFSLSLSRQSKHVTMNSDASWRHSLWRYCRIQGKS